MDLTFQSFTRWGLVLTSLFFFYCRCNGAAYSRFESRYLIRRGGLTRLMHASAAPARGLAACSAIRVLNFWNLTRRGWGVTRLMHAVQAWLSGHMAKALA